MRPPRPLRALGVALAFAALALAGPAEAALAPLYESIREISTILDDPRLGDSLRGAGIVSILDNGKGGYVFATEMCSVTVDVLDVPPTADKPMMPGPREFTLEFEKPVCK